MPFSIKPIDFMKEFDKSSSVLIVACNICPRMSIAADNDQPYFDLKHILTGRDFFTSYLKGIQNTFAQKNIQTEVFNSFFPAPMMCLWMESQRTRLADSLRGHDAIAVFGCESAVATVTDSAKGFAGPIIQIVSVEGIANFIPKIGFPFSIYLKPSVTSIVPLPTGR